MYNTYIEKPKIKLLKTIDLLYELLFYGELTIVKTDKTLRAYAMTYKVKLIDKKDPLSQLEAHKSSTKYLLNDLLDETNDLKYQITVKILLKNTKALKLNVLQLFQFNNKGSDKSNKSFQEILYRINN